MGVTAEPFTARQQVARTAVSLPFAGEIQLNSSGTRPCGPRSLCDTAAAAGGGVFFLGGGGGSDYQNLATSYLTRDFAWLACTGVTSLMPDRVAVHAVQDQCRALQV